MILWISCKKKSLRYPRFLWVKSLLLFFSSWGRVGMQKWSICGRRRAQKQDTQKKTACGEATHPLWRHYDPCLIHSARLRVLTWMVCDLDRRCTFFHFYECCSVGRNMWVFSRPCSAWPQQKKDKKKKKSQGCKEEAGLGGSARYSTCSSESWVEMKVHTVCNTTWRNKKKKKKRKDLFLPGEAWEGCSAASPAAAATAPSSRIYLFMVLQPLDRPLGASPLEICHFSIIVILMLFFFIQSSSLFFTFVSGFSLPPRDEASTWCRTFHISVQYRVRANSGIVSHVQTIKRGRKQKTKIRWRDR